MPGTVIDLENSRIKVRCRLVSPWLAGMVVAIAITVLIGWVTGSMVMRSVVPGMTTMKINTALGLFTGGLSVLSRRYRDPYRRWMVWSCLIITGLIGLLTLVEYVARIDLKIDNLFIVDRDIPLFAGRPAPATAACMVCYACVLALLERRQSILMAQILLALMTIPACITIGGYIFRAPGLYANAPYPVLALNTSIALILLSLAALLDGPDDGIMRVLTSPRLSGDVLRTLLPMGALLPLLAALGVLAGQRAGMYSQQFGFSLLASFCAASFIAASWWTARLLMDKEAAFDTVERRFRSTFDQAAVGLAHVLPNGQLNRVNHKLCEILGYDCDVLLTKTFQQLSFPEDLPQILKLKDQLIAGEIPNYSIERRYIRQDGSTVWTQLTVSLVRGGNGDPDYLIAVIEDRTARKLLDLELIRAKDAAEAASRAKDQFLAVLSHELRTPLTPVLATVDLMQQDVSNTPETCEALAMIRRNVTLEARLIDDLLDLTRIARGKIELHQELVDVHSAVSHVLQTCRWEIESRQLSIELSLNAKTHFAWADPTRLHQVLGNVLNNSIKFTPPAGQIKIRTFDEAQGKLAIEITDTGTGIEPAVLPRLFNAFEQGEVTISRRFGGLGLGLSISKSLLDLHGGTITARSRGKNQGSTFTIVLRAMEKAENILSPTPAGKSPPSAAPVQSADVSQHRILLVEDNSDTLRMMKRLLTHLGFEVESASSMKDAIEMGRSGRFDMLVSDIGLPDGSGWEIMKALKKTQPIRGVAISGFGMEEDLQRSKEAGFEQHLVKPVSFEALRDAVKNLAAASAE